MKSMLNLLLVFLGLCFATNSYAYDKVVDINGSGDYTSLQAAIDAAPTNAVTAYTIFIKNGTYYEKINIPSNKPFITIIGESTEGVILTYDDYASKPLPGGGTVGTQNSASFTINATDFTAVNITFVNSFGDGSQAVAVLANNDRAVFKNCRFLGNQDTLYIKGSGNPKHYFNNCYIDGNVDFIFGSSMAIFDSCVIFAKNRVSAGNSYITAANTTAGQAYGYVFNNCLFTDHGGTTLYFLGRPWQNSTGSSIPFAENKTVLLNSRLNSKIRPDGWSVWDAGTITSQITYAEYKSRWVSGDLIDTSARVSWSKQLSDAEAATYTMANIFGAWNPCAAYAGICDNEPYRLFINNFKGVKGAPNSSFSWNLSWPKSGIEFKLFRATSKSGPYAQVQTVTSPNDSIVVFGLTEAIPPSGSIYYYFINGSTGGMVSRNSDTIFISSAPTINTTGPVADMYQTLGNPSPPVSYSVSGTDLADPVIITPPAGFEVSGDAGATWNTNASPLALNAVAGTLASKTILVRLNESTAADFSGNIVHTSTGADTVKVAVKGKAVIAAATNSQAILRFPLNTNANDLAAERSVYVNGSTISGNNLYVSNGTTVGAIAAYSAQFGMAFGATANGDGSWGTGSGGPGGNLNRIYYLEFPVQAKGRPLRVDSLILAGAFYNTGSNTRIAMVYSLSQFVSDSTDVTGGTGPGGVVVGGGFSNPIALSNQTAGPTNTYRVAINGPTGIELPANGILTVRFYFSCSSSSAGRYGMIKELLVKGEEVGPDLLHFTTDVNAADNDPERSPAVKPSTIALNKLYVSNGTTVGAIQAYSPQYGMAYGATANGDGTWGTAAGGPGGNLNRTFYLQIPVETNANPVRVDSIVLASAFYNTSSNTKLAIVYSLTDFTTGDSTDVTGGTGPGGTAVGGAFLTPIALANQTSGPTNTYRVALNGGTGVLVPANSKLTIRLYFSCGSSSAGRYGMLKDVYIKGKEQANILPLDLLSFEGQLKKGISILSWKTSREERVKQFDLEYSSDGVSFKGVGTVAAKNSTGVQQYEYEHHPMTNGQRFYRLKMTDQDGHFTRSQVIVLNAVLAETGALKVVQYTSDYILVQLPTSANANTFTTVVSMDGRIMKAQKVNEGSKLVYIHSTGFVPGVYRIVWQNGTEKKQIGFSKF